MSAQPQSQPASSISPSSRPAGGDAPGAADQVIVTGGPTAVVDLGGLRLVIDPTLGPAGGKGYLVKTAPPALSAEEIGVPDAVLISHDDHPDNLDAEGRAYALAAPLILTNPGAARRLGVPAVGLAPWESYELARPDGGALAITAVPAIHGPIDGERGEDGFINAEVTGFVLSGEGLPTVYLSGDNASVGTVVTILDRLGPVDWAVLNIGAARVPTKFDGRPLSLTSERAAAAAQVLSPARIIPAHYSHWTHFSQGVETIQPAFDDAGVGGALRLVEHGTPVQLD